MTLSENSLTGTIPSQYSRLWQLTFMQLSNNSLVGTLPSQLVKCSNLWYLFIDHNSLTGSLPSQLSTLNSLPYFRGEYNQFCGPFDPTRFPTTLAELSLSGNSLSGPLSRTGSSRLSQLSILELANNSLTGTLPRESSGMRALSSLDLGNNRQLCGPIPAAYSALTGLHKMNLASTQVNGSVPHSLCALFGAVGWFTLNLQDTRVTCYASCFTSYASAQLFLSPGISECSGIPLLPPILFC
jgi:hypothetical protein